MNEGSINEGYRYTVKECDMGVASVGVVRHCKVCMVDSGTKVDYLYVLRKEGFDQKGKACSARFPIRSIEGIFRQQKWALVRVLNHLEFRVSQFLVGGYVCAEGGRRGSAREPCKSWLESVSDIIGEISRFEVHGCSW